MDSSRSTEAPAPKLPPRALQVLRNRTGLPSFSCDKMAPGGGLHDVVIVKASCELRAGRLALATEHVAPQLADELWPAARVERSSLKAVGDVVVHKPATDVYVTGHAETPDRREHPRWRAGVAVHGVGGALASLTLSACGPRVWTHRALGGWVLSDPVPAWRVPIRYELAFGGAYGDARGVPRVHRDNPAGRGFVDPRGSSREPIPAPQWETIEEPIGELGRSVARAGFGPVARPWESRLRWAGTYDAAWRARAHQARAEGRLIDYPADFDARFFQCAPDRLQIAPTLRGDEHLMLDGLVGGVARFVTQLPGVAIRAGLRRGRGAWDAVHLPLDTVHVDLDERLVHLVWRSSLPQRDGVRGVVLTQELLP